MPLGKDFKSIPKGAKDYELIAKWYLSLFFLPAFLPKLENRGYL